LLISAAPEAYALGGSESAPDSAQEGEAASEERRGRAADDVDGSETGAGDGRDGDAPGSGGNGAAADEHEADGYSEARRHLVQDVLRSEGITDSTVLEAMLRTPRHRFVPERYRGSAYANRPLPIGHGQTISQPYIVAYMTEKLDLEPGDRVLEVGTGSGYQAAVLAEIVSEVYSIEIIDELASSARDSLRRSGYANVRVKNADGYYGWQEHAPYDAVIVTAAAGHVPPPLVEQLEPGGRMVIPLGGVYEVQSLVLLEKRGPDNVTTEHLLPVRFVPMTGRVQDSGSR
jgi:protein-L-isoaspartate(D-aspartate) O-methyltransferase